MKDHRQAGILPDHHIQALYDSGAIACQRPLAPDQVQPASLDLRLGARCWRLRASFLPGSGRTVRQAVERLSLHEINLTNGAVLEAGTIYLAEVQESLALPDDVAASANPKSSTGRIDVFTRVIADHSSAFDQIAPGYRGLIYAEISPRTFPVLVREGSRLSQVRFRSGLARLDDVEHRLLHERDHLVTTPSPSIAVGVGVSVDLAGFGADKLIGYRARRFTGLIDVDVAGALASADFWEPITAGAHSDLVLDPGEFYILASREAIRVPPDHAAEMTPFDPLVGEFRVHYAGFFDPGFGAHEARGAGARAVLEVRSRDVPFVLEDGQMVARLVYERMAALPRALYGAGLASNYQAQGLKLSKHFRV